MATLDQQIEQNVSIINADTQILHNIVHGTDNQTITTENGEVPTMAKIVKDNLDTIVASRTELDSKVTQASTSATNASAFKTDAETIKTEVANLRDEMAAIFNNVGDSIGQFAFFASENIPDGWLRCDGSTVNKTTYPNLVAYLNNGDTEAENAILPNAIHADGRGRFLRDIGLNDNPLDIQEDTMQNITGTAGTMFQGSNTVSGVFNIGNRIDNKGSSGNYGYAVTFDASRVARTSDETRPLSLFGVLCIKAFHGVINTGELNVAGLSADVQSNSNRLNSLELKDNEVVLWENGNSTGDLPTNSTATLSESLYNYPKVCIISGFNNPLTNRQTPTYALTSQLQDGLILYGASAGTSYYELELGNNGTTLTGRGYSGNNIRVKKIIGIK